ncbi:3,4-dihydroxy-2-butanone-4-phosphate synthase [Chitinophaga sp. 22321]|uniref:3,4-dihydroxy-2-butanone 4-phosphate synthase n=1 Tax=Chitinophaga hostae TaxID=2831022 RepID=A0ABS5J9Q8_9BACT|nr:3,4-dihydroxy-2-butanone-4-phosphate synthase [Chitinophaga hostae]MBS0031783.1 3,4-dihydroxy-2-butanone-4-phosphate synthase [Chitinophaga hostae]
MERINKAVEYLATGKPVLISDSVDRENEYDIAFSARHVNPQLVKLLQERGGGLLCLVLSSEKAGELGIQRLNSNGNDFFDTPFGFPISYKHMTHSAVSIEGRAHTIVKVSEQCASIQNFVIPGHIATLIAKTGGLLERNGHTEAIVDLLKLAGEPPVGVLCEVQGINGGMADQRELKEIFSDIDTCEVSIKEIAEFINGRMKNDD